MSTSSFYTPVGTSLKSVADALFGGADRNLLGLRAEGYASRNLANQMLAQDRAYDFGNKQQAFQDLAQQIQADPENKQLLNLQMGMRSGMPNKVVKALINQAIEADRLKGLEALGGQEADMGFLDKGTGMPANTNVADMLRIDPKFSSIGSGMQAPSKIASEGALKEKRESETTLNQMEEKRLRRLQAIFKDKGLNIEDAAGEILAKVPMADLVAIKGGSGLKPILDLLESKVKMGTLGTKSKIADVKLKKAESEYLFDSQTYSDRFSKIASDAQISLNKAFKSDLDLRLAQQMFPYDKKKRIAESLIQELKYKKHRIEAEKGTVKGFTWRDDGSLAATGTRADGSPFVVNVPLPEGMPKIPKTKIIAFGKDQSKVGVMTTKVKDGDVSYDLAQLGDRGAMSVEKRINLATKIALEMQSIVLEHPDDITGGGMLLSQVKEFAMALFNVPAQDTGGKRIDYRANFAQLGNQILLLIAPFILNSTGSKISDKDMIRIDKAFKIGSVGTGITEIQLTMGSIFKALKAAQEAELAGTLVKKPGFPGYTAPGDTAFDTGDTGDTGNAGDDDTFDDDMSFMQGDDFNATKARNLLKQGDKSLTSMQKKALNMYILNFPEE